MTNKFHLFAGAVRAQFNEMALEPLFVVNTDRDEIWQRYLAAFPPGTDPMFRKRTEHDCACCRAFIRQAGNVVAVQNGALTSIWDVGGLPSPYQEVADAMSEYVKACPIRDVYLTRDPAIGTPTSHEYTEGQETLRWNHFAVLAPERFTSNKAAEVQGDKRTTFAVLKRGITELTPDAVQTVADLIAENAIYRGAEFGPRVAEFKALQDRVLAANEAERDWLIWRMIDSHAARFRNSAIGALVQDLSEGKPVEAAVRSYETMVAPQNYKRPTSLITKGMVEKAMETIRERGLESALERRHARFSDVSVNDVLFVDNAVRGQMKGGIEGLLMEQVKPAKFDAKKAEPISIEAFLRDVLPKTTALQVHLENGALGNLMSMTAPVHADAKPLFRWGNSFGWSYDGNVTDSIKERVKSAGGKVEGVAMRVSLAWSNYDDLDLHIIEPDGNRIYFGNKCGMLDVDMNAGRGTTRQPVENVRWVRPPRDGTYDVVVHQYSQRERIDVGFTVEIESAAGLETFSYERAVSNFVPVASVLIQGGRVEKILPASGIKHGTPQREKWGVTTQSLVRVNSIVQSPNYWDRLVGNKHWFFILEGCKNPDPVRGIYNEFLAADLEAHRKVFEILGEKTKCPPADEQMSGLGFSSTKKDQVTVVATGPSLSKAYTIAFG